MKTLYKILPVLLLLYLGTGLPAQAQDPILAVIKAGITKAIVAMDLKIQRLQNKTIWLQQAQKVLENKLTDLRLTEIADWTERQRQLYATYYEELWQVKAAITYYQRARELAQKQEALVNAYRRTYRLLREHGNFAPAEMDYIRQVYGGLLEASLKDLDGLLLILNAFSTQMSDGDRLALIHELGGRMDRHYTALRKFNDSNIRLALRRAGERNDLEGIRQLYDHLTENQ
ncbi:conjugal transfer protein TraI [Pontibacter sp. Tf4]|uniref:conjugal transfer protein TraI n=1 Tax=Pontibacter sp. Tf4 TaxID=2761620 RepID=UPI0016288593|nr:conjugal transfer protein TraI [Pontibacter sp. Tf4]MBB6611812.1 conjugal transfer protein TraI [Pontibacter sp. Tf4]